jgi:hypothetical protein
MQRQRRYARGETTLATAAGDMHMAVDKSGYDAPTVQINDLDRDATRGLGPLFADFQHTPGTDQHLAFALCVGRKQLGVLEQNQWCGIGGRHIRRLYQVAVFRWESINTPQTRMTERREAGGAVSGLRSFDWNRTPPSPAAARRPLLHALLGTRAGEAKKPRIPVFNGRTAGYPSGATKSFPLPLAGEGQGEGGATRKHKTSSKPGLHPHPPLRVGRSLVSSSVRPRERL